MPNSKSPAPMSVEEAVATLKARYSYLGTVMAANGASRGDVIMEALDTVIAAYEESQKEVTRLSGAVEFHNRVAIECGIEDARQGRVTPYDPFTSDSHLLDTGDEEIVTSDAGCYHEAKLSKGAVPLCYGENHRPFKSPVPDTEKVKTDYERILEAFGITRDASGVWWKRGYSADSVDEAIALFRPGINDE